VPSTAEDPALLKTGFFRQAVELKIQRKNPGSALRFFGMPPQTSRGIHKAPF